MTAMDEVEVGMPVLDSAGMKIGEVDEVKFGDPEAVTDQGQRQPGGLAAELADAVGAGSRLHPQADARLHRMGYLRVDLGFLGGHGYAAADWVVAVEHGAVRLSVGAADLHHG